MTSFHLSFAPLIPWAFLIAFGVAALVVLGLGFWTRRRGTWWRALGLIAILVSLAEPRLIREDRKPLKDIVPIVLDASGSQTIGERTAQTNAARAALERAFANLPNVEPRFITGGEDSGGNEGTKLFSALKDGIADVPPDRIGAAIFVTDGVVHDIPKNADALGFKAPLHALITGHEGERDRRIELIEGPRFGIVGQDQTIVVRVLEAGNNSNAPIDVDVRRDGQKLFTRSAVPGEVLRIPVPIEHAGQNVFELEVASLPDELTTLNNKLVVTIDGIRDKLRVLLVSGEPHEGERAWRNLLRADANIDLVHFTILRSPESSMTVPENQLALIAFPTQELFERDIEHFDLIIFDRYSNQSLILPPQYLQNIADYVQNGGALLMSVGPEFASPQGLANSPMSAILPGHPDGNVLTQEFRPAISDDGPKHPVTRDLPGSESDPPQWGEWFRQIGVGDVHGNTLMSGIDGKPLLVLSHEGKGRVALMLSDQMWLWAREYQGGGPHLELMRRVSHWLMKEPELEEEALRAAVQGKTIFVERQSLKDGAVSVKITAPSGKEDSLALSPSSPGLSKAQYAAGELGLYKISDGEHNVLANVGTDNPLEFQDVISNTQMLKPLADETRGTIRRLDDGHGGITMPRLIMQDEASTFGGGDYIGIHHTGASVIAGVAVTPLALGWDGILVLLGLMLIAWLYEGRTRDP